MRGKVVMVVCFPFFSQDHPCVCGEKQLTFSVGNVIVGSPLRMRGKDRTKHPLPTPEGITPAYAGKREVRQYYSDMFQDHPCVCGEKELENQSNIIIIGSPLRMRGKVSHILTNKTTSRITPAYAGKRVQAENKYHHH